MDNTKITKFSGRWGFILSAVGSAVGMANVWGFPAKMASNDGVAYLTWDMALKGTEGTATVANLAYLTPFLSLVVSMIVLDEPLDERAVIALVFIVGGILLQSFVLHESMIKEDRNEHNIR